MLTGKEALGRSPPPSALALPWRSGYLAGSDLPRMGHGMLNAVALTESTITGDTPLGDVCEGLSRLA